MEQNEWMEREQKRDDDDASLPHPSHPARGRHRSRNPLHPNVTGAAMGMREHFSVCFDGTTTTAVPQQRKAVERESASGVLGVPERRNGIVPVFPGTGKERCGSGE
ncbi:hypothetical protein CDAR_43111 [Caerostris darwini]|uniref:Uncharacterized protein n=1 Tax=Caerostris darwini TaxID=1538125 RepID=A0AAV4WHV6_9ARAC|nr:hypothetical protein CDAR_43111 [Caerostris darwini]